MKKKGKKRLCKALAVFMTVFLLMSMMPQVAFADPVVDDSAVVVDEQAAPDDQQSAEGAEEESEPDDQQPEENQELPDETDALPAEEADEPDAEAKEEELPGVQLMSAPGLLGSSADIQYEEVSGTVYITISEEKQFITDQNGKPMAYVPISLESLTSIDLDSYGLSDYLYDADNDGAYEITALHLYIYVHEQIMGRDWDAVTITGSPGSIYFAENLFGFSDENLRYDLNGTYPTDATGYGVTADRIILDGGDFINVAHYSNWFFHGDSATGFHYFADGDGSITRSYSAKAGEESQVKLIRSYSDWSNGGAPAFAEESGYEVFYGTSYGSATGTVTTDETGCANITFPSAGTWYVWCDGGEGIDNAAGSTVSSPAYAAVEVAAVKQEQPESRSDSEEIVYISVSYDGKFLTGKDGTLMAYVPVAMSALESIDLNDYELSGYIYDSNSDGKQDITALHLDIYIHETVCGESWNDVVVSGGAGSLYFESGLFGFETANLRYDLNGSYPAVDGWGITADRIVISGGDFMDVASYSSWGFYTDPATGFHYFTDDNGVITHNYSVIANESSKVSLVKSTSDLMTGGDSILTPEAGYPIYYGKTFGEGKEIMTSDDGTAEITFTETGTWYIWCYGGIGENLDEMTGSECIVSSPAYAEVTVTAAEQEPPEPADPIDVYVTIANKGEIVLAKDRIEVQDRDSSGDFNIDEVLYAAHENTYSGGAAAGYTSEETAYGLGIKTLWGDSSGNYGYWLDHVSCMSLSDSVVDGDSLVAFVYQNTDVWDSYAKFVQNNYATLAEVPKTVSLQIAGYDGDGNTVFSAHKGAALKVYDSDFNELEQEDYEVVDHKDGTYSVTVMEIGSYFIAAYDNKTPIVPALCEFIVTENADVVPADAVEAKIDAIGEVTLDSKETIEAAREAYENLTDTQKALVENYDVLTAAENDLLKLQGAAAADEVAATAVEALIDAIGTVTIHSSEKIKAAREEYNMLSDAQQALVGNYGVLTAAEAAIQKLYVEAAKVDHKKIYKETEAYISGLSTPSVGSTGGEWMVIDLTRAGKTCPDGYYENVVAYVREHINANEQLHNAKSTDNSRVILGLTAAGYDVTDVDGHNLLMGLTEMGYVKNQGINGPIWALIAFDSYQYEIPTNPNATDQVTREKLIDHILGKQLDNGGWALSGKGYDPDITGMAIQALAPYYKSNEKVKAAVDKAVVMLSEVQHENGGFSASVDGSCTESCAQVIVALTALGIDPETDPRFVKNGMSVVDAMCLFAVEGGGFVHVPGGTRNGMATEQSQYALVAYYRFLNKQTSLYDMTDVTIGENPEVVIPNDEEQPSAGGTTGDGTSGNGASSSGNASGATGSLRAGTKAITKAAKIGLTANLTEEAQEVIDQIDTFVADVAADLPENAADYSEEQMQSIVDAYKAYMELSDEEKLAVEESDAYKAFTKVLEKIADFHHYDEASGVDMRENGEDVLPWHIRMVIEPKDMTKKQTAEVNAALGEDSKVFTMNDIYFINILDGNEWHPGDIVKVKKPMVHLEDYKHAVIVHITDDNKIELLEGTIDGDTVSFHASSFSLYGIAGTNSDIFGMEDSEAVVWPWIVIGIVALAAIGYMLYRRKKDQSEVDLDPAA